MIREATFRDKDTLLSIWKLYDTEIENITGYLTKAKNYNDAIEKFISDIITSNNESIFVYEKNNVIIGFTAGHIEEQPWHTERTGIIGSCWVENAHRRQGIGTSLTRHVECWLESKVVSSVEVIWDNNNETAVKFWLARGYTPKLTRGMKKID